MREKDSFGYLQVEDLRLFMCAIEIYVSRLLFFFSLSSLTNFACRFFDDLLF